MATIAVRRAADARRRKRQPYRKLFDHIRQGCRLKTPKFSDRMAGILGYDYEAFRAHIESTFTHGMTWDLFLSGQIHIDHRIPLALFDQTDLVSIRAAWALSNIRAAWPEDNIRKLSADRALLRAASCGRTTGASATVAGMQ